MGTRPDAEAWFAGLEHPQKASRLGVRSALEGTGSTARSMRSPTGRRYARSREALRVPVRARIR